MTNITIALLLFYLQLLDPYHYQLMQAAPAPIDKSLPGEYLGWSMRTPRHPANEIAIDTSKLEKWGRGPKGEWVNPRDQVVYGACTLAHEVTHFRYGSGHELPYLHEYVCLDRLGAPQWLKDSTYRRLQGATEVIVWEQP